MEYGLWQKYFEKVCLKKDVLILVLMEYGLWHIPGSPAPWSVIAS